MTRAQKIILTVLSMLVCFTGAFAIWLWGGQWQRPLGPALRVPTATPFGLPPTWTPDPKAIAALQATSTVLPASQVAPLPTITPNVGLCGAPPVMNILAIGT